MEPTEQKRILPSGKFVLIVLLVIIASGAGYYFYATYFKNESTENENVAIEIPNSGTEDDFDADGLENWEEFLWKTDPQIADTDGDGTSDGEEVALGRDPRVAGPNDDLSATNTSNPEDVHATDQLTQQFAIEYFGLKQSGAEITPQTQADLIASVLENNYKEPTKAVYGINDLAVTSVTTQASLKKYGNDLGQAIILASAGKPEGSELNVFIKAAESNDESKIADLEPFITAWQKTVDGSLAVSVPEGAALLHLNLVNSFYYVLENVKGMREATADPFLAMISVNEYIDSVELLNQSLFELAEYMSENNVTYQQTDYGSTLFGSI